jgi:hypothetical protein
MPTPANFLRRYTDLPALVYLLTEKRITLLDPETWDDRNDSYFLRLYRDKKQLASVLALCFSQSGETYHHWRVFANGPGGVCITFKREELLGAITRRTGVRTGRVKYMKLPEIRKKKVAIGSLPFLKRAPFQPENEFRVIFESREKLASLDIPIPLSSIDRITLSPWLHPALSTHVKRMISGIRGCKLLDLARSTLINNEEWKRFAESAVNARRAKPA